MHVCKCMSSNVFYEGQYKSREIGREGCILMIREDLSVESVAKIYLRVRGQEAENGDSPFRQKPESVWWV